MNIQEFINHHPAWFAIAFPVYFVGLWLLVSTIISLAGGWYVLSQTFRARVPFDGSLWSGQSGYMRWFVNYGHCLKVGASSNGLYLATLFLFSFMHPPLLVPWNEINIRRTKLWVFGAYVTVTLGNERPIRLRVTGKLADKLRESAAKHWPVEENRGSTI